MTDLNSLIVAMDKNGLIGKENKIPWKVKEDLKKFKEFTSNHVIIMGSNTFESLGCKPLPNRENIVLTRKGGYYAGGNRNLHIFDHPFKAMAEAKRLKPDLGYYVIGGSQIYDFFLKYRHVDRLVVSEVKGEYNGDTYFPDYDKENWVYMKDLFENDEFTMKEYIRKCRL